MHLHNTYNNNDDSHNDSCDGGVEWGPGEERIIRAQQGREAAGHRVSKTDTNVIYHTCPRSLGGRMTSGFVPSALSQC